MNISEQEYRAICRSLNTVFGKFIEYTKHNMQKSVFSKELVDFQAEQIKYKHLDELASIIANDSLDSMNNNGNGDYN